MKKKLLSLILAGMMLVLPACNQNTDPDKKDQDTGKSDSSAADTSAADTSDDTSADTDDTVADYDFGYIADSLPEKYNFDGAEYNVAISGWTDKLENASSVTCEELTSDAVKVSLYNTSRAVEERFGCKIQNVLADDFDQTIRQMVATSDSYYSVFASGGLALSSNVVSGYYTNLYNVPYLDLSQPWWTSGTEELSIADRAYLGVSYLQYNGMENSYIIFVNKDVADRYELTVPYEDVFAGTWTADEMYTLASQATAELNGDGIMDENDGYGFNYMEGFTKQIQCSFGVHIIAKDENNLPIANLDVEAGTAYLAFMEKLKEYTGVTPNGSPDGYKTYFNKGNVLFMNAPLGFVFDLLETDINYGFLPVPKLTEDQEEYEHYSHSNAWIIPTSCAGNLEFVGMITEALNAIHFNEVRPVYLESTMKGRLAETPEDAQVLDIISRTLYADFGFEYSQTITPVWEVRDLFDNKSGDATTTNTIASTYKKIEKKLDNYINKLFLGKFNKMVAAEEKAK